jgi:ABC-type sugar transport system substrate-binding protein
VDHRNSDIPPGLEPSEIADYPDIKILNDHQYANYDPSTAMSITEDLITKYGDEIDLVVTQDGGMFEGAYNALASSGKLGSCGIICQGQDLIVREKLESGELYASVAQDPTQEGTLTVDVLDKLIKGEEVEPWTYTPTGPIFAEDVDDYSWF